jgi:hypothetical protein
MFFYPKIDDFKVTVAKSVFIEVGRALSLHSCTKSIVLIIKEIYTTFK